jgi:hypothetical protein
MNTKSLLTRIGVPVLSLGLLGGLGATLATSASASTMTTTMASVKPVAVTANTHLNDHPDTTSVCNTVVTYPGVGVIGSDCVWAHDNVTEKFTAVQNNGSWLVTMGYVGSFHGFADPRMAGELGGNGQGAALDSNGSVKGTIQYTVTGTNNAPDPSRLPGQSPSDATISSNIRTLFGDQSATVTYVPGSYVFTYHQIEGQDYTQVG